MAEATDSLIEALQSAGAERVDLSSGAGILDPLALFGTAAPQLR